MEDRNKIGLGTVQFGLDYGISNSSGKTSKQEVKKILHTAKFHNIEILDSASGYGNAEEILGKNNLNNFKIVSKFLPPSFGVSLDQQIEKSLLQLKINEFYGYLAHRPLDLLSTPGQWEFLQNSQRKGIINKIGFSLNEPEELHRLLQAGMMPDLVQVPFNYFDRRFETDLKDLKNNGCEIHTRSAFLQGLFFMDPEKLDDHFLEVKPVLKEIQAIDDSLPGRLLTFVTKQTFIDKVIIGVENSQQLEQNISELKYSSSLPELNKQISKNILIPSRWPRK